MLSATDFGWCPRLDQEAQQNPNNYRLSLGERFRLNDQQLDLVLGNVARPADAYTLLRLGEMAKLPPEQMLEHYQADQAQGWGVMAKNLGIKPGSAEFHALKRGHDLRDYRPAAKAKRARFTDTKPRQSAKQQSNKKLRPAKSPNRQHHRNSGVHEAGQHHSYPAQPAEPAANTPLP